MNTTDILFTSFAVAAGVQLIYWLIIFTRFSFKKPHETERADLLPPVSVVIVGRNEEENFASNLPLILNQDYPDFEVIAVNNQSIDDSERVIEDLQKSYAHLKLVRVPENDHFWHGKKFGLMLGIKAAENEHLVFTDADCVPDSPDWIREMISGYMGGKEIVLGYGDVTRRPGLVNALSRFETVQTAIQYFAWTFWGMPYMGVGRNLSYKKSLWFEQNGFLKHAHIPSGDDDLFVNSAAQKKKVGVVAKTTSHTRTESKTNWNDWVRQKRRHFSTSSMYRPLHQVLLGTFGSSMLMFWMLFVANLFVQSGQNLYLILGIFGFRLIAQWSVGFTAARFLGNRDIVVLWPFYEVVWLISGVYLHLLNRFAGPPKGWK